MHTRRSVLKIFSSLSILAIAVLLAIPSCSSKEPKTAGTQEKSSPSPALKDDVSKGAGPSVPASQDEGTRQGVSVPFPQNPQNSPPSLTNAYFRMETRDDKDILTVVAEATDKDGDEVAFTYEWTKNGESAGSGDFITGFKRGDKISVKITPFDGKEYGHSRILNTEINNTPPKITAHKDYKFDGVTYSYQVRAYDPDGDALTGLQRLQNFRGALDRLVPHEQVIRVVRRQHRNADPRLSQRTRRKAKRLRTTPTDSSC
jgi:hypothetical protein